MNLKKLNNFNWFKTFSRIFDFFILAIIFGTPLYLSLFFKVNNIFDLGKLSWFQICLSLAVVALLLKILIAHFKNKKIYFPGFLLKIKIYFPSLILIIFLSLSLFWSQDAYLSFFGSYYRNDGLINWFFYFIFAVLVGFYLVANGSEKIERRLKNILISVIFSASLVSIYAICQYFGIDFISWQEPAKISHRASSTLFQPNFLASFLLLTIPFSLLLAYWNRPKKIKYLYLISFCLQILALVFTGSRGAWLSFFVSLLLFLGILFFQKKKIPKKNWLIGGLALTLIFSIFFLMRSERFQGLFNFSQGSTAYRVEIYQAAIKQIKLKPLLGYGNESQGDRLVREYQQDWALFESPYVLPDRAHNLFLDITLCFGLIGLFVWLFWYRSYFCLLKNIRKESGGDALPLALAFAVFSYLFSLLFSFSVATTSIYLFLFLGIVWAYSAPIKEITLDVLWKKLFIVISLFFAISFFSYSYKTILADYYFYYFNQAWNIGKYENGFGVRENIINLNVADIHYRKMILERMASFNSNYENIVIKNRVLEVIKEEKHLFKENLFFDAEKLMGIELFSNNFAKAEEHGDFLLYSSPLYPKNYYLLGLLKARGQNYEDARAFFGKASSLFPDSLDYRLSEKHKKDLSLARSEIFFNTGLTYELENSFKNASSYYGLSYLSNENNLLALLKIAFCFDELGEKERADSIRTMLEEALNK